MEEGETMRFTMGDQSESINGVYIPKNIQDCFLELDKFLKEDDIRFIKEQKSSSDVEWKLHMGLGLYIRNNWGLWVGSRLYVYMRERL